MRVFALILLGWLVAGCGRDAPEGYPPEVEFNFIQACEAAQRGSGVCPCTWDRIEAGVAPRDLLALERLPANERASHPLQTQIETFARECAAALPPPAEPAPTP